MKPENWKTIAIVFIILFLLETLVVTWSISYAIIEENKLTEFYYDICEKYPDAEYKSNVCVCYDYDISGELNIVKTEVLK